MPPSADFLIELEQVLASPAFAGASAHRRLLRYLVENSVAGRGAVLKETVLGIEVFMRPADSFDPRRDSIVRVEARRLRERLRQHYADSPGGDWMITLPKGSYLALLVPRPPDPRRDEAAELVERGLFFLRQGHEDGHRKALQRFEAAARAAPALAAAHAGVARARLQLVTTNIEPPRPGVELALAAVRRALALQPAHADSLVLAAQLTHRFEFDWPAARSLFDRATRAAPASPFVRHSLAFSLLMRADFDAAERELAAARRLDPLHLGLRAHLALLQLYRREWAAAEITLRDLLDMSPDNVLGLSLLAYVALCRGDADAALRQYRQVCALHPGLSIGAVGEAMALAAGGATGASRQRLDRLEHDWRGRYLSPYQQALVELRLANEKSALTLLERAVDERDPNALCLPVDPAFDALARAPRFKALAAQVLGGVRRQPLPARECAAAAASRP